jgi:Uncharacterized conserved protein
MLKKTLEDDGSEPIIIRAHHLLCIQGFQGLGYSEEFTKNMARLTEKIQNNPSFFIKVISGADSICKHCPHLQEEVCNIGTDSGRSIRAMDLSVLKELDIESGSLFSSDQITVLTDNMSPEAVKTICGKCGWRDDCLYFQEKCSI